MNVNRERSKTRMVRSGVTTVVRRHRQEHEGRASSSYPSDEVVLVGLHDAAVVASPTDGARVWLCSRCGKVLGVLSGGRVHLRFSRGYEYMVGFPVTGKCTECGTLNELSEPLTVEPDIKCVVGAN